MPLPKMGIENKNIKTSFVVIGDIIAISLSYGIAHLIRFGKLGGFSEIFPSSFFILLVLGYVVVFYFFDLYSFPLRFRRITMAIRIALATGLAAAVVLLLKYIFFLIPIGRGILLIANLLIIILVLGTRYVALILFKFLIQSSPVIVVGKGKAALEISQVIKAFPDEFRLIGYLDTRAEEPKANPNDAAADVIGAVCDIREVIHKHNVKIVILSDLGVPNERLAQDLLRAQLESVEMISFTDFYQKWTGKIPVDYIDEENWFLKTKGFNIVNNMVNQRLKRLADILISGAALILSLPLWPVIAFAIRIDSKGPVFYTQTRVGRKELPFSLFKFRSMIEGAEDDEPIWAQEGDKRITCIGRVLRRLHLDEIPQLWNILRGEMGLVGPRPERPEFVETLKKEIPYYSLRHFIKPGLTGWAQINYPYAASLLDSKEKLEYDLFYIAHRNLLMDAKILARTGRYLLFGRPENSKIQDEHADLCEKQ
jgi:exopolysaccharide biosynthesis polyprenyl glycosylphosphotransferase